MQLNLDDALSLFFDPALADEPLASELRMARVFAYIADQIDAARPPSLLHRITAQAYEQVAAAVREPTTPHLGRPNPAQG